MSFCFSLQLKKKIFFTWTLENNKFPTYTEARTIGGGGGGGGCPYISFTHFLKWMPAGKT